MTRQTRERSTVKTIRRRRAALLDGTALQYVTVLFFATHASAQPAPNARPSGGQVVAGLANIGQSPTQTTVNQASGRAAINWQSFDVGSQQTVRFNQPSANAVTLNRVTGPDPSQIAGKIVANGNIIITNPSGVAFSKGAQVDVNGLIVSAPGISTQNFMAGRLVFDQAPKPGAVVSNAGTITVKQAGLAALVAPQVANSGVINARLGHVVLAGAEAHTIDLYGDGLVSIDVTKAVTQVPVGPNGKAATALVTNTGTVIADGGTVQITARAADGIVTDLVRAGGTIRANTVGDRTGRIEITGVGGSVRVEGRVAADGETGGTISVRASDTVTVANGAAITANGRAGGGTVALGTTLARAQSGRATALVNGSSPLTPAGTARRVVVQSGATVSADGGGGTVTTLSTQSTEIDGLLTTQGGGVIEASSVGALMLNRAPNAGKGGTLYLDPYDLIIGTGAPTASLSGPTDNPGVPLDSSTSGTSYIAPATLAAAAQNGAVTISLNAVHDLTVQEAVSLTSGQVSSSGAQTGGASLYLHAGHDLTVLANITIGAAASGRALTLDAGHAIVIGVTAGSPAVTLAVDGNVTITTTGSFAEDPLGSSISVHDGSVISSNAAISLEASNRIDVGSNVQMSAGLGGSVFYNPQETNYTGILVQAGTDIALAANTTLTAVGGSEGYRPTIILDAGGSVSIGPGSALNVSGTSTTVYMYAGSATEATQNANAPAPAANGSVALGAGSLLQASAGLIQIGSGTGGTMLAGTVEGSSAQLSSNGAITETATGTVAVDTLTANGASVDLGGGANQIGTLDASSASSGDFSLDNGITPLVLGGALTASRQVNLTLDGLSFCSCATITATTLQLTPYSAGRQIELVASTQTDGGLSIDLAMIAAISVQNLILTGNLQGVTIGNAGETVDLTGHAATLTLGGPGAITEGVGAGLRVGTLAVTGSSSITLAGQNQLDVLTAQSNGDISIANAQTLRVDVASTPGDVTITTTSGDLNVARTSNTLDGTAHGISGAVVSLNASGNLLFEVGSHPENVVQATTSLALNAGGTITEDSGAVVTPALTGFAAGASLVQPGNQIGTLGSIILGDFALPNGSPPVASSIVSVGTLARFSGTSALNVVDAAPLTVAGPISAGTVTLSAVGALTLQGGQFTADVVSLSVVAPSAGAAALTQTGTTSFAPGSAGTGTLLLALPGSGSMTLQGLSAPAMSVSLTLGTGTATGTIDSAALNVSGQSGTANLTGSVAGRTGAAAAVVSAISPTVDPAYRLNGCSIGAATCLAVIVSPPTDPIAPTVTAPQVTAPQVTASLAATPPVITVTDENQGTAALLTPKSFLNTELGNSLAPDLLTIDLITIGIVRDTADAALLLPNISDRDY